MMTFLLLFFVFLGVDDVAVHQNPRLTVIWQVGQGRVFYDGRRCGRTIRRKTTATGTKVSEGDDEDASNDDDVDDEDDDSDCDDIDDSTCIVGKRRYLGCGSGGDLVNIILRPGDLAELWSLKKPFGTDCFDFLR